MSSIILTLSMLVGSIVFAGDNITVKLNGQTLSFDVQPQVINGRTMVPMRTIFEKLGATVEWEPKTRTITSVKGDTTISLTIGIPSIKINQQYPIELDAAPCIVDGRTLVPVRAISEAFHMNVDWNGTTKTVIITQPNINMTAYNKLKRIIMSQGSYSNTAENYVIYYNPRDKKYSISFFYEPEYDFLTLYYKWAGSVEETVMISIHPNMNPSVYYKSRSSSGNEYALHANYPKANQPFVETSNTFPKYFEPQESLTLNMTLMDILMQRVVNMSLADFGLYYVKS